MMSHTGITLLKRLALCAALLPLPAQAAVIKLAGTLSAANQNGSDPALVTDPNGVVPTYAKGFIALQLDDVVNTLDIQMKVIGIKLSDLKDFGPNTSPIHLHNAAPGSPGNFGPIAIDPTFTASPSDFSSIGYGYGFTFERKGISILAADQGNVTAPGMHPGDDKIIDALLSGNMFVAVHTNKPDGFPFVEIRGNFKPVSAVPLPTALPLLGSGLIGLFAVARRRL